MNLLRDCSFLRLWRRVAVRRPPARAVYTVTVPAPLADAGMTGPRHPVVVTRPATLPLVVNG